MSWTVRMVDAAVDIAAPAVIRAVSAVAGNAAAGALAATTVGTAVVAAPVIIGLRRPVCCGWGRQ